MLAAASVLLAGAYAFPLWRITLQAPQYPEGIGMLIWTHTVTGVEPHHLQNINGLNHYIGMKTIDANAIPELRVMPWLLGALILGGFSVVALGRRSIARAWLVVFVIGALAGLADFWRWQYDYGHNLDLENAAIKVPGMTYQPPMFGSKQLLNFTATSWPGVGGWLAFGALALAGGAIVFDARGQRRSGRRVAAATAVAAAAACAPVGPRALVAGEDVCGYCRMVISDVRYGAQAITSTGKVLTFDSVECLAGYAASLQSDSTSVRLFVADFDKPDSFVQAETAIYLFGSSLGSPMGRRLAAFAPGRDTAALRRRYEGDVLDWAGVRERIAEHEHAAHTGAAQ